MRPHGRAEVSATKPRAKAVCDRCGALYNHDKLIWQYDWAGPKLQNLRFLVCQSCYDTPQQNGQRTILIPPDPIPINNPRPENYVLDSNPLSAIGANASPVLWNYGTRIGTMVNGAGVTAAFDGNANKPSFMSASISVSGSSYQNYVGINWGGQINSITPSSLNSGVITHTVSNYIITAPNDAAIGSSAYVVQGSIVDAGWGSWTTIASGSLANTPGEVVAGNCAGTRFQFHRAAFLGDGINPVRVAQVALYVSDGSSNGIT